MPSDHAVQVWIAIANTASSVVAAGGLGFVAYQLKLLQEAALDDAVWNHAVF